MVFAKDWRTGAPPRAPPPAPIPTTRSPSMLARSADRVDDHIDASTRARIRAETERRLAHFAQHAEQIDRRLRELDEEWDIERVLETGSSALTLTGLLLGIGANRKWLLLSLAVQGFFLQH